MTDREQELVDQLRSHCDWCKPCTQCRGLMSRAAGEIERLMTENVRLRQAIDSFLRRAKEFFDRDPY